MDPPFPYFCCTDIESIASRDHAVKKKGKKGKKGSSAAVPPPDVRDSFL